jgi:hypothetical protein
MYPNPLPAKAGFFSLSYYKAHSYHRSKSHYLQQHPHPSCVNMAFPSGSVRFAGSPALLVTWEYFKNLAIPPLSALLSRILQTER